MSCAKEFCSMRAMPTMIIKIVESTLGYSFTSIIWHGGRWW